MLCARNCATVPELCRLWNHFFLRSRATTTQDYDVICVQELPRYWLGVDRPTSNADENGPRFYPKNGVDSTQRTVFGRFGLVKALITAGATGRQRASRLLRELPSRSPSDLA